MRVGVYLRHGLGAGQGGHGLVATHSSIAIVPNCYRVQAVGRSFARASMFVLLQLMVLFVGFPGCHGAHLIKFHKPTSPPPPGPPMPPPSPSPPPARRNRANGFTPVHSIPLAWPSHFESCLSLARLMSRPTNAMWVNISKTLHDVGRLRVLVVGGSETAGVNCDDGETRHKACSWPARLGRWLESPGFRVEVENQASGGTTISASFPSLGILLSNVPDIFIVDFVVNDAFETQDSGASLLSAYEAFIIRTRRRGVFNLAFVVTCALEHCAKVRDVILWASTLHDVAFISYYDVAHCAAHLSGSGLHEFWDTDGTHPSWRVHQLIADTVAFVLAENILAFSSPLTLSETQAVHSYDFCSEPMTEYSAFIPPAAGVSAHQWSLEEDRPGKPGWITYQNNSSISFQVSFGASPRLAVTWLRSYIGLGDARMTLNGRSVVIHGLYDASDNLHVSQAFMHLFQAGKSGFQPELGLSGMLGFGVSPFSNQSILFETAPELAVEGVSKFKLISIYTC